MAHLTDQRGNPIQLTDEFGNPVTLTDEHGNPMHLSGVAYSSTETAVGGGGGGVARPAPSGISTETTMGEVLSGPALSPVGQPQPGRVEEVRVVGGANPPLIRRSTSSGSTSSEGELGEEEGTGTGTRRRRQKKGITEKLKEKLNMSGSGRAKDTTTVTSPPATSPHKIATTDTATQKITVDHVEKEKGGVYVAQDTTTSTVTTEHKDQAKKGVIGKIMEKLPGHH